MMRLITVLYLIILFFSSAYAHDLASNPTLNLIETKLVDGKKTFHVEAGTFPNENSALQQKLRLAANLHLPVYIEPISNDKLYTVKIGPLDSLQQAEAAQKKVNANFALPKESIDSDPINVNNDAPIINQNSEPEKKLWNLQNADIRAVIGEVSRVTGKNFIIDPRVQGKVSIVSSTPLSDNELYQVFLSVLQISGYAAIPSGAVTKIIPNIDTKVATDFPINPLEQQTSIDEILVQVIAINYVPAEQLVPVLRPLMPQWSNVSAFVPSNRLVLSGRATNIRKLVSIIKQIDSPTAFGIDMVPLKHALAMDVVNTLKDITKPQANALSRNNAVIAADDRSNTILVSGSRTERLRFRLLIAKLDKESAFGNNSNTQVVYLNYLRAEDLVPILAGVAQANFSGNVGTTIGTITRPALDSTNPSSSLANNSNSTTDTPAIPVTNNAATPTTNATANQSEGSTKPTVNIIAEPNTNSVIINAPASLIKILKTVINQLDILPAQILIEALVAEVNESDVVSLGIEWGSKQQSGDVSKFKPGFAILNSKTSIADFQAQLYALATEQKANILSTPSVVVLDNRQAKILVGKQVSVASTTYPNNGNGTALASPYVTYDRVNVALHLYVRPQVTRDRGIQLQIDQGNDELDPSYTPESANPTFKISSIVTSVHVESGDIVILGGLTQDSLGNNDIGLPILAGIPGIGRLFQHNIRNREKRVLMVFIRPIVLRSENAANEVSGGKYNNLRQYQQEWLRSQDFHETNKNVLLPALTTSELPRPFRPLPIPVPPTVMTK